MSVDSAWASQLLTGSMEDRTELDSDECTTDDETDLALRSGSKAEGALGFLRDGIGATGSEEVEGEDIADCYKMKEVQTRQYQVELLQMARENNLIICLPTGSGKTYIALKLTEEMLPQAIENNQKIIFLANNVPLVHQQAKYFSVNLVSTCVNDDNIVRALSGDLNVDVWKQEQWDEILSSYHILVMSTQIFLDALTKNFVQWKQVALLILDECHHAQKDHPMAVLMRNYGEKKAAGTTELPKVLGLTATIIKGQSKELFIPRDIEDIEKLLCSKAVTHRNYEEILKHSTTNLIEPMTYCKDYLMSDGACQDVKKFMDLLSLLPKNFASEDEVSLIESINHPLLTSEEQIYNKSKGLPKTLYSFLMDLLKTYEELGPYCCKLAAILKLIYIIQWIQELDDSALDDDLDLPESDSKDRDVDVDMEEDGDDNENDSSISSSGSGSSAEFSEDVDVVTLLYSTQTILIQFMKRLDIQMEKEARAKGLDINSRQGEAYVVKKCVSNKVSTLWDILSRKGAEDLCGLVFCQRRITAQVLRWYFEKVAELWPGELGFIRAELMLGNSTNVQSTEASRFTAKRQTQIIRKFHAKQLNLLIATQVVEEGLNVPACNLVVRFDPILTYPSMVQSLGRARRRGAICYALIDVTEESKEVSRINSYFRYNQKLAEALEKNALHVGEEDDEDYEDTHNLIPPFNPTGDPNGPVITATDAISLVHRYCNGMSCDRIATLMPHAFSVEGEGGTLKKPKYKAFVQLPIISPVKETVEGDWMPDKTLAKRSAFMAVCKRLWEADELTPNLLPKPRNIDNYKCDFLQNLDDQFQEEKVTAVGKIGTRKRVQWIEKMLPDAFEANGLKSGGCNVSIYRVKMRMVEYTGDPQFRSLYDFDKNGLSFGILTKADLSKVGTIKLIAHYGTLHVTLRKCRNSFHLTSREVENLRKFQSFLAESVYWMKNPALEPDDQAPLFLAPFKTMKDRRKKGYSLQWDLVKSLLKMEEGKLFEEPEEETRKQMQFDKGQFENRVIVPWYKKQPEGREEWRVRSGPEYFCTVAVLPHVNPRSTFDDQKKFSTFEEYYSKHYGLHLFHPEHPLILCKNLGTKLNFLTSKQDGRLLRQDKLRSSVKLVPELVNIHPLPGSLLVQGRYIPSVIHRITRLLLAEEKIRSKVAERFDWCIDGDADADIMPGTEPRPESGDGDIDSDSRSDVDDGEMDVEPLPGEGHGSSSVVVEVDVDGDVEAKRKEKEGKKRLPMLLLEMINPLEIKWEQVIGSRKTKKKKTYIRDSRFSMPEPPARKSEIQKELVSLDSIKFKSFDERTDFSLEKGPSALTLMEALTLSNAQDTCDLERLEVLGDSLLKLVVSLHIFRNFPTWDEGKMTLLRMKLISNRHLYQLGKPLDLPQLLSGGIFIPSDHSLPPGLTVPQDLKDFILSKKLDFSILKDLEKSELEDMEELENHLNPAKIEAYVKGKPPFTSYTHTKISDKSVADSVEALIGAYHWNGGIDSALRVMEWMGFRGPTQDGSAEVYSRDNSMAPVAHISDGLRMEGAFRHVPLLRELEETLCYTFRNPWIAVEALTHPTSMSNRQTNCYERLEYIGDAVLDFLVTDWILKNTNITDPGKITDLRSALVNNVTFGSLAVRYGFHTFFKYSSETLGKYITKFAQFQDDNNHEVTDPHELFGEFDCPTVREIEVPKVLGDIFESIAGAVLVDSGMSIDTVWRVFYRLMKKELEKFSKNIPKSPLRQLYEKFPGKVKFRKIAEDSSSSTKSKKHNHCATRFQAVFLQVPCCKQPVIGIGSTLKQAKLAASKFVIRQLSIAEAASLE